MSIISCFFFKSYFYFIAYWILEFLDMIEKDYFESHYIYENNISNDNITNNTNYDESNYIQNGREIDLLYVGLLSVGDMSAGFLVAYTFIRMNCFKKSNETNSKAIGKPYYELIYNDPTIMKNKYSLILLTSLLDILARGNELLYFLFVNLYRIDILKTFITMPIEILSRILFCHLILKTELYKHHFISIFILIIGFLTNTYFGIIGLDSKNDWLYLLFKIISRILFGLEDIISKILLTNKFLLAHYLMFLRGSFSFIIFLFLFLILFLTSAIDIDYYHNVINSSDFGIEFLRKLIIVILSFFKSFCIFRILYIFSPQHVGFCNIISFLIETIKHLVENKAINNLIHFIFDMISLIFIFLGTLIFNEMIIINAYGLDENTKVGKIKKELLDHVELNSSVVLNENENEDNQVSINDINIKEKDEK